MKLMKKTDIKKYTLGTWQFGGQMDRDPNNDDQANINSIKMHIDTGVNQIFTAQNYANGWAEKIVGQAISNYDREDLVISSAIKKQDSSYDDMLRSVEESLKRLNLDYLDIVVHHAPIQEVPIKESVRALNAIVDKGLARGIAVSNYNSNSLNQALNSTNHEILFNQVYYNLFVREVEEDGLLDICKKNNVLIQAFRPLELGELTITENKLMSDLAKKYSVLPSQIALSWLTSQDGVVIVTTTHNQEHLNQNLKAVQLQLKPDDIEELRSNFPKKKLDKNWIR
jgi:diketogulonate reductase-like aldo/keto reductase